MQVYLVLGLVFAIGVALFAVQNAARVDITLFFWQIYDISLVVVILASALIGAITAGLFGIFKQLKISKRLRSCNALAEAQKAEIEYLQKRLSKQDQQPNQQDPNNQEQPGE